jgi:hypothetical protein
LSLASHPDTISIYIFLKNILKIIQKHEENIFLKFKFKNFLVLASQPDTISTYFFKTIIQKYYFEAKKKNLKIVKKISNNFQNTKSNMILLGNSTQPKTGKKLSSPNFCTI